MEGARSDVWVCAKAVGAAVEHGQARRLRNGSEAPVRRVPVRTSASIRRRRCCLLSAAPHAGAGRGPARLRDQAAHGQPALCLRVERSMRCGCSAIAGATGVCCTLDVQVINRGTSRIDMPVQLRVAGPPPGMRRSSCDVPVLAPGRSRPGCRWTSFRRSRPRGAPRSAALASRPAGRPGTDCNCRRRQPSRRVRARHHRPLPTPGRPSDEAYCRLACLLALGLSWTAGAAWGQGAAWRATLEPARPGAAYTPTETLRLDFPQPLDATSRGQLALELDAIDVTALADAATPAWPTRRCRPWRRATTGCAWSATTTRVRCRCTAAGPSA